MTVPSLELRNVSVHRGGPHPVVRGVSFTAAPRARIALLGPNGAGKTSLLLAMVGAAPHQGQIAFDGRSLASGDVDFARRYAGLLFSEPADQLFCATALDEVAFGVPKQHQPEVAERARCLLARVGLSDVDMHRPAELSLGQQRRLALAAVLACEPAIVLCDEPTAALDPVARRHMLDALAALDSTLVLATHDLEAATRLGCEALLLHRGESVAFGPAERLLRDEALLRRAGLAE